MTLSFRYWLSCTKYCLQRRQMSTNAMAKLGVSILPRVDIPPQFNIQLTEQENELCVLLNECTDYLKNEKGINTSCRIAGGWVRDKLLGSQSNDIDIALADIMGYPFAQHLSEFASLKGIETSAIAIVEQNAEQSKHLETAKLKILGFDLDLVNLRSEEYANNSRIPTGVTFGTPVQDALRRDITINALFYNVHTREVEDLTGEGLSDLREGNIRTPLAPRETFLDDPLRALRCLRFASRFGFTLSSDLADCLRQKEIQDALVSKVSRERVGDELHKMMQGRSPLHALQLIHEAHLYPAIFCVYPPELAAKFPSPQGSPVALSHVSVLQALLDLRALSPLPKIHPILFSAITNDPTSIARLYMAASLAPFLDLTYLDKKDKTIPAVDAAIRESLKIGSQDHMLDGIPNLFIASKLLKSSELLSGERYVRKSERTSIAILLRDKSVHDPHKGSHWTTSLFFALLRELSALYDTTTDTIDVEGATKIITSYNDFVKKVEELDLLNVTEAVALVHGADIQMLLKASRGRWVGRALEQVLEWQFDHPQGTKAQCEQWLLEQRDAGNIEIDTPSKEPARKKPRKQ